MSAVNYDPIEVGDSRNKAPLNSIFADMETASSALDARNFAEEGLDAHALEAHPVGSRTGKVSVTSRPAASIASVGVFTNFVHNGTTIGLTSGGAQIPGALLANEKLRVRARLYFETTVLNGVGVDGEMTFQIVYNAGAGAVKMPYTLRYMYRNGLVKHGVVFIEGWLSGAIGTLVSTTVQYKLRAFGGGAGGTAFPSYSMIWATKFNRCTGF